MLRRPSHSTRATTTCQCGAAPEAGQQHRRGDPQPGRDLGGRGARLDQFQDLLGEPAPYRAGRVAPVPLDRDQLGDALEQVEPLGRASRPASASTASSQSDSTVSRTSREARAAPRPGVADREERVRRTPPTVDPVRPRRPVRVAARCSARQRRRPPRAGSGSPRARDLPAGGGEHPGPQVQVGAEQVEDHVGAAARRARTSSAGGAGRRRPPDPRPARRRPAVRRTR